MNLYRSAEVQLQPAGADDLRWITRLEREPATARWILPWTLAHHRTAAGSGEVLHQVVWARGRQAGFAMLAGLGNAHRAVELRRLVVAPRQRGRGLGAAALDRVMALAFTGMGAHRVWLDVKSTNSRAIALYRAAGFQTEGRLRECLREDGRWTSLLVMSVLEAEREIRR